MHHAAQVFAQDIKFDIHNSSCLYPVEIGVLVGIGNNGYRKSIVSGIANSKTDSVHTYGTLFDSHIALQGHSLVKIVFESITPAPIGFFNQSKTAVWSTCPCTICPSRRPFTSRLRSRLTLSPGLSRPRFVLSRVSCIAVTVYS